MKVLAPLALFLALVLALSLALSLAPLAFALVCSNIGPPILQLTAVHVEVRKREYLGVSKERVCGS